MATAEECRRPIRPDETELLVTLGMSIRQLRLDAGLTQDRLAWATEISSRQLRRIEAGQRRTRLSTLSRLTEHLADASPELGSAADMRAALVARAGQALAPESAHSGRVERRRNRRRSRTEREPVLEVVIESVYFPDGVWERHTRRRRIGRGRYRVTTRCIYKPTAAG